MQVCDCEVTQKIHSRKIVLTVSNAKTCCENCKFIIIPQIRREGTVKEPTQSISTMPFPCKPFHTTRGQVGQENNQPKTDIALVFLYMSKMQML